MLTWVLFYLSIFRTSKSPVVDVIDPGGVVRSQVIESDGKALRLTLNGAENRQNACRQILLRQLRLKRAAPGVPHKRHIHDRGDTSSDRGSKR